MTTKRIEFPALGAKQKENVEKLLQTIRELMEVEILEQDISIKQVEFDASRKDVEATIRGIIKSTKGCQRISSTDSTDLT